MPKPKGPLPGAHYCKEHQGNEAHYSKENCLVCQLTSALRRMFGVYEALMPGLRYISVKDYQEINEAPIAAHQALMKSERSEHATT